MMNTRKTLTIFLMTLIGFRIAAMQQPNLRIRLIIAVSDGDVEQVEKLMLAGAPVTPKALYWPTVRGYYDVVKTIFESGIDPESPADPNQIYFGKTIFEHLLRSTELAPMVKEKLIRLYIKHGADLDRISSPITKVHSLEAGTLELLLNYGVDVNARDTYSRTALMKIAEHLIPKKVLEDEERLSSYKQQLKRSAEVLIKHGADVNLTTSPIGETSLMMAARRGNRPLVELLLENGANINLKNLKGESALDYAKYQPEILKLLKDAQKTSGEKS